MSSLQITESYKNDFNAFITSYFDGSVHPISEDQTLFPKCSVISDVRLKASDENFPVIQVGEIIRSDYAEKKCEVTPGKIGYEAWVTIRHHIYVTCNPTKPPVAPLMTAKLIADRVWDLLFTVFVSKREQLQLKFISTVNLSPIPTVLIEGNDNQKAVLVGNLSLLYKKKYLSDPA